MIRVEDGFSLGRYALAKCLQKADLGVAVHYPTPIYKQPLYQELGYGKTICPQTEDACRRILSLPVHPAVTRKELSYIVKVLKQVN